MVKYDFTDFLLKVEEISQVGLKYSTDNYALDNYYELSKLTKDYISNIDKIQKEDLNVFKKDVYPTPNVSVRTIFLSEDKKKVFLVREAVDGLSRVDGLKSVFLRWKVQKKKCGKKPDLTAISLE